ncbi:hypothetical protein L484_006115 [Morus notabilis]|uniref:Uncharacterized protein n=1 Tax=Morus notabilis TaxID=981085 RepID=W9SAW5_9ROSA|nr:hypothetical protein L484_006115 [Morus notabilis]
MGSESSNQEFQSKSLQIPEAKQPTKGNSGNNTMSPICRLSPNYKGSALYDSYELQAVVHQLNKAIQGSKAFSPIGLKSPFYRKHLNRVNRENKSPRRLTCSAFSSATTLDDNKKGNRGAWVITRVVVTRLWMKVKQGFLRNKNKE